MPWPILFPNSFFIVDLISLSPNFRKLPCGIRNGGPSGDQWNRHQWRATRALAEFSGSGFRDGGLGFRGSGLRPDVWSTRGVATNRHTMNASLLRTEVSVLNQTRNHNNPGKPITNVTPHHSDTLQKVGILGFCVGDC